MQIQAESKQNDFKDGPSRFKQNHYTDFSDGLSRSEQKQNRMISRMAWVDSSSINQKRYKTRPKLSKFLNRSGKAKAESAQRDVRKQTCGQSVQKAQDSRLLPTI